MLQYKDQVILVTGGGGAIGSNLCQELAEIGARKVIVLDDLSASYQWNIPNLPNILFVSTGYELAIGSFASFAVDEEAA